MYIVRPFSPARNFITSNLAVSLTPSSVQFDNILPAAGGFNKAGTVRLFNAGPNLVFVELVGSGVSSTQASVGNSVPIAAGTSLVLLSGGATSVSAVTAIGNATLYATPGEGGI